MKTLKKTYILLSIIAAILVLFYMAFSRTALFSDGGHWIYAILNGKWFWYDVPHSRYASFLFQLPSVLTINLSPTFWGKEFAIDLFCFSYVFHPAISLLICYFILKKENKTNLLAYPLLTYASVISSSLLFGVGIASEALTYFWPLLFILLKKEQRYWHSLIVLVLSVTLSYSYELSLGLLALALVANVSQGESNLSRKLSTIALLVGIINLSFIIYGLYSAKSNNFWFVDSFKQTWTINLKLLLSMGGLFFVSSFLSNRSQNFPGALFYFLSVFFMLFAMKMLNSSNLGPELMWNAHHARTMVVPAGFVIAFMMLVLEGYLPRIKSPLRTTTEFRGFLLMSAVCLLNFGSFYNVMMTKMWRKGLAELESEIARRDMCYVIDRKYQEEVLGLLGVSEWTMPALTTTLNKGLKIKTVLFSQMRNPETGKLIEFDSCHSYHQNTLFAKELKFIPFHLSYGRNQIFDFTHILKNVKPLSILINSKENESFGKTSWDFFINFALKTELFDAIEGEEYNVSIGHSSVGFDGLYAHVTVRYGGKVIHEFTSQNQPEISQFTFVANHTGESFVEISFDNDRWESNVRDINLSILSLDIAPARQETILSKTVLFENRTIITKNFKTIKGKEYQVAVRHSSTAFEKTYAHGIIRVGNRVIHELRSQSKTKTSSFTFIADHTGESFLEIVFDNDRSDAKKGDINLKIVDMSISSLK